jgi:large-conductance mechanosensitive channel
VPENFTLGLAKEQKNGLIIWHYVLGIAVAIHENGFTKKLYKRKKQMSETKQLSEREKELNQVVLDRIGQELDDRFNEWKAFAFQQRTFGAVIAFTLGIAFSKLITAFSESLIMPIVQFLGKYTGETWRQAVWEPVPNLKFEVGQFYAAGVDFILMSLILYALWKVVKHFKKEEEECPNACCVKKS